MSPAQRFPLVAVDIGNSGIKLGWFETLVAGDALPEPDRTTVLSTDSWDPVEIALWLAPQSPVDVHWLLASVHQPALEKLENWLRAEAGQPRVTRLTNDQLPLEVDVTEPDKVGIDRLLGAVAVNHLRPSDRAALVIDLGTAITVDVVSQEGSFRGGSILPGIAMSARALHEYTDRLPDLGISTLEDPPPPLGASTDEAIASGLFWGAVGAVRILIEQLNKDFDEEPFVVLTGGAARQVAELLEVPVRYEPHLVLAGMLLAATAK